MLSILPEIKVLKEIPQRHRDYAKDLLGICMKFLFELEEIIIDTFGMTGSFIAFDSEEFEYTNLKLQYDKYKFTIVVTNNYEDFETSLFRYSIDESDSELFNMIPERLRTGMEKVAREKKLSPFSLLS